MHDCGIVQDSRWWWNSAFLGGRFLVRSRGGRNSGKNRPPADCCGNGVFGHYGSFILERTHIAALSADGTHVTFGTFHGTITPPGAAH
jgi:hypothetical protein